MSFDLKIDKGDVVLGPDSDLRTVENSEKLTQEVLKVVSTPIGGNPFFPWYGSPIQRTLVGTAFTTVFISSIAETQLRTSIENLQGLQKEQLKTSQVVTPQEQIAAVQNVLVERNSVDPRFFRIQLTVLSKAFRQVQTSLQISL